LRRLLIALFILISATTSHAQWSTTGSGNITVSTVLSITLSNQASTPTFTTASDYQNGKTITNYATIAIKSNVDWLVSVKAQSTYFTPQTVGASNDMPASVLGIRLNGNTTFLTMSTTSQTLKTGTDGNAAASGHTFKVDMKFNPGFNYAGGLYNMSVMYTVTQQ